MIAEEQMLPAELGGEGFKHLCNGVKSACPVKSERHLSGSHAPTILKLFYQILSEEIFLIAAHLRNSAIQHPCLSSPIFRCRCSSRIGDISTYLHYMLIKTIQSLYYNL